MSWLSNATGMNIDLNQLAKNAQTMSPPHPTDNIPGTQGPNIETDAERQARVQQGQQQASAQFQQNLPFFQRKMAENLSQQANQGMYQNMRNVEQRNASRGLGYGGLNEGMKEQQRAQSQQALSGSITQANKGLLDLGQQYQTGAINTGLGIQADLQNQQNQIYQQALAQQQTQNQMQSSFLGMAANAGMLMMLA